MKKIIIIEYSKGDMASWMELRITNGIMEIKHGESIQVTQVTIPTQEQIEKVRKMRWFQATTKAAWNDAIDWLLNRLSLNEDKHEIPDPPR